MTLQVITGTMTHKVFSTSILIFVCSLRDCAVGFCLSVRYLRCSYNLLLNRVEVTMALHSALVSQLPRTAHVILQNSLYSLSKDRA
jgi:hypothetical protein